MMTLLTLLLLAAVLLPIIYILGMLILELIADLLFLIVRLLDFITSNKTERRIKKDKEDDNGIR